MKIYNIDSLLIISKEIKKAQRNGNVKKLKHLLYLRSSWKQKNITWRWWIDEKFSQDAPHISRLNVFKSKAQS